MSCSQLNRTVAVNLVRLRGAPSRCENPCSKDFTWHSFWDSFIDSPGILFGIFQEFLWGSFCIFSWISQELPVYPGIPSSYYRFNDCFLDHYSWTLQKLFQGFFSGFLSGFLSESFSGFLRDSLQECLLTFLQGFLLGLFQRYLSGFLLEFM